MDAQLESSTINIKATTLEQRLVQLYTQGQMGGYFPEMTAVQRPVLVAVEVVMGIMPALIMRVPLMEFQEW